MQIVINITEEDYEKIRETSFVENIEIVFKQSSEDRKGTMMLFRVIDAIKNGTPLPKGHGRLIDVDKLHHCECKGNFSECDTCLFDDLCNLVNNTPTIIEADKAESEE